VGKAWEAGTQVCFWPALRTGILPATEHIGLFRQQSFDTVLDVGANKGQFAVLAAALCPNAVIHSFEPLNDCYAKLFEMTKKYPNIRTYRYALGSQDEEVDFEVSRYPASSSVLRMNDVHVAEYPGTQTDRVIKVRVQTLDSVAPSLNVRGKILIKLDVQGFELEVLHGAHRFLQQVEYVYLEASFLELYEGQPLAADIIDFLRQRGFKMEKVFYVSHGRSGQPVQADILFRRWE